MTGKHPVILDPIEGDVRMKYVLSIILYAFVMTQLISVPVMAGTDDLLARLSTQIAHSPNASPELKAFAKT